MRRSTREVVEVGDRGVGGVAAAGPGPVGEDEGVAAGEAGMKRLGCGRASGRGAGEAGGGESRENGLGRVVCTKGGDVCAQGEGGERIGGRRCGGGGAAGGGRQAWDGARDGRTVRVSFRLGRETRRMLAEALGVVRRAHPGLASEDDAIFFLVRHLAESQAGGVPGLRKLARRYPVHERDGWRCMVPGCSRTGRLQGHHVILRSKGDRTRPGCWSRSARSTTT